MSELKPCPFCGEQPELEIGETDLNGSATEDYFQYHCDNCGIFKGEFRYIEDAISDWNSRAQPTIRDYIKANESDWKKCHRKMVNISSLYEFIGESGG